MNEARTSGQNVFGPAKRWVLHLVVINPVAYLCLAVAAYGLSPDLRKELYLRAHTMPAVRAGLVDLYRWLNEGWGWWGVWGALGAVVLFSFLVWQSHSYRMDNEFVYKRTGLLGTFDDPMALSQIIDANMPKNVLQRVFGTGDLILVVVDRPRQARNVRLYYVEHPDEVRQFILDRCGGRRTAYVL